jgi:hypothetical protein
MSGRYEPSRDDDQLDIVVMACRTVAAPTHPELRGQWNNLAPLDPGFATEQCEICGTDIHVGVRQLAERERQQTIGKPVVTACMWCAVRLSSTVNTPERVLKSTRHLGGR